jgi:hypothetical protein
MKKTLLTLLILGAVAIPAMANDYWYWADQNGYEITEPIEVAQGETVRVWTICRTNIPGWPPQYWFAQEVWWDTTVVNGWATSVVYEDYDNYYLDDDGVVNDPNGDGLPTYMVSDLTVGNYGAAPDFGFPDYEHYGAVVLQDVFYQYAGLKIVGIDFTIREDAPVGTLSSVGGRVISRNYWNDNYDMYETIDASDPFALTFNILPGGGRLGDFDNDGDIDADDIDALAAAIQASSTDTIYDMDGDGDVDADDFAFHVHNLVDTALGEGTGTEFGDFNLDGMVSILDLGALGDGYGVGTGWAQGDANGDGTVGILDLGFLGDNYGYDGSAIPEPATMSLLGLGAVAILRRRR